MDNNKLVRLIKRAQGRLSQNEFSRQCGISSSNLTRIYRDQQKPSPNLLKKIADYAQQNPSYEDLMTAAGYWSDKRNDPFLPIKGVFNYRLKKLMVDNNISIDELSENSRIPSKKIKEYIEGKNAPDKPIDVVELAIALGVSPLYLSGKFSYKNTEERDTAFTQFDTLQKLFDKLDPELAKQFSYCINNAL